jgi:hypothetical protein
MTEAEWKAWGNSRAMLGCLERGADLRKLRLFACACLRTVWGVMHDDRARRAVEVAELFADGAASLDQLESAGSDAAHVAAEIVEAEGLQIEGTDIPGLPDEVGETRASLAMAASRLVEVSAGRSFRRIVSPLQHLINSVECAVHASNRASARPLPFDRLNAALEAPSHRLRDIFGNPFRPFAYDPAWLQWNGRTIPTLAKAVYEEREAPSGHLDPVRLALMADMLEDAGCTDPQVLEHLRGPGPHVRGCWVVDLLLGKE